VFKSAQPAIKQVAFEQVPTKVETAKMICL